ncbi:MAG: hypothetical protein FJ405_15855 [Verrucomicrobia bacterium]|nr:hypothetical protein [Verrucomicrobiota bacterium]
MNPRPNSSFVPGKWRLGGGFTLLIVAGIGSAHGQVTGDWTRYLRVGAVSPLNLKASFSMEGTLAMPSRSPGATGVSGVDHFYDDGFVRVDQTGNAGGLTSFWGYNDASQYNAGSQQMTFRSASAFQASSPSYSRRNEVDVGMEASYGGALALWGSTLVGWDVGFNWLPFNIRDSRSLGVQLSRSSFVHSAGFGASPPQAPYTGGSSGLGPLIGDVSSPGATDTVAATLTGYREIDATMYGFRVGPTAYWDLARRWALQAGLGAETTWLRGAYAFKETTVTSDGGRTPISGRLSQSTWLYGGYAQATVMWRTAEKADLYLSARYSYLGSSVFGDGVRSARLDLKSGVYLSAGINWPF